MDFHWIPMEFQWNSIAFHWFLMEFQWKSMDVHWILTENQWYSMRFHGLPLNPHGISMKIHSLSIVPNGILMEIDWFSLISTGKPMNFIALQQNGSRHSVGNRPQEPGIHRLARNVKNPPKLQLLGEKTKHIPWRRTPVRDTVATRGHSWGGAQLEWPY